MYQVHADHEGVRFLVCEISLAMIIGIENLTMSGS